MDMYPAAADPADAVEGGMDISGMGSCCVGRDSFVVPAKWLSELKEL
jgi:hypothetical protein